MVRIRRLLKILQVARCASCRETLELPNCGALVTILTLHRGVSTQERESILVILDLLDGDIPTEHRMTPCAIGSHLPLVNIGVAVLALLANIRKYRLDVTLRTLHFFVHAPQRILCLIVVELRHGADRAPSAGGVAIFARNLQRPVRASRRFALRFRSRKYCRLPNEEQQPAHHLDERCIYNHPVPSKVPRRGWNTKNLWLA
jgi:hypothetical protein